MKLNKAFFTMAGMALALTMAPVAWGQEADADEDEQAVQAEAQATEQDDEEAAEQAAVEEQNELSDPDALPDAGDAIDEWAETALQKFGLDDWGEHDGKIFVFKAKQASIKNLDPQFGDALAVAFDEAMADVQAEVVMLRFGRIVQDKVREFYSDTSTDAKDIPLEPPKTYSDGMMGKIMANLDKALDVAGAKLDQALMDLGVSQEKVAAMPVTKKKTVFYDSFVKTAMKTASGDISGIFPIQTTVVIDDKGNAQVGIIAVTSAKTQQVARDIAAQRKSLVTGKGRNLSFMKPEGDEQLLGTLGVRLAYDEDGTPAIVSYAISSYVPDGDDDFVNSELKRDAKQSAIDTADGQIAEVVNGYMSTESVRQNGQVVEKFVEREMKADSMTSERLVKNIVKISRERARSHASMKLQGCSTLQTKTFKLPSGQVFYAVTRIWKYSTLKAIQDFNSGKYTPDKPAAKPAPKPVKGQTYEGKETNTLEDF